MLHTTRASQRQAADTRQCAQKPVCTSFVQHAVSCQRCTPFVPISYRAVHTVAASAPVAESTHAQEPPAEVVARPVQPVAKVEDEELCALFQAAVPAEIHQRNAAFAAKIKNELILAPLTKGGNLPFRQLCLGFGARVTMSEMAFGKQLLKRDRVEMARLKRDPKEEVYGFQIATKQISQGIETAKLAADAGAAFMDLNCGCPIHEATSRGLGAALLRKPQALSKLVHGIVMGSPIPVTVKVRTGESEKKVNVERVVTLLEAAGAAAVTVHGRTTEQRYRKPADWNLLSRVATSRSVPIVGNGDILTPYEARRRLEQYNCHAVMVGRGALIKPWIFQEMREGRELCLNARERVGIYRKLVMLMKAHFGDDALGKRKAWYFLPWHFSFFHRYRPLPAEMYEPASLSYPLIMTRMDLVQPELNETLEGLPLLERLLRNESEKAHTAVADVLWESGSDDDAIVVLERLAVENLAAWEADVRQSGRDEQQSQG